MTEREEEPGRDRIPAVLHHLARDVVDRGYMIGVEGMPESETVCEKCHAKKQWVAAELRQCPRPDGNIGGHEYCVNARNLGAGAIGRIVKDTRKHAWYLEVTISICFLGKLAARQ